MADPIDRDLIRSLFLKDIPLIDVRAPVEFSQGAFPKAVNLPLMDDDERHKVGLCYKQNGQEAAIKLGHKLVSGDTRQQRIAQWQAYIRKNPDAYLYCFRGGLRSRTTQQWLQESGVDLPLINGGYKAMRRVLLDELEQSVAEAKFVILGGRTGTGKTWLLKELSNAIDLEGLANHRGSSFGRFPDGQPGQIDFENNLSILLMKYRSRGIKKFWLEDESRLIGSIVLPQSLQDKMKQAPLIMLEEELSYRVNIILKDYVIDLETYYHGYFNSTLNSAYCENNNAENIKKTGAFESFSDYLLASLDRIQKRLGGERHQKIRCLLVKALEEHRHNYDTSQNEITHLDLHRQWIELLLVSYYDPMYDYQLEKKKNNILFQGNSHQIIANQKKILDLD
jgi:tRNA 2-selenouridine synthase